MNGSLAVNKQGILGDCASKAVRVEHLPFNYHVHLNMPCNQRCIMCVPDDNHGRSVLSFESFLAFFEQIKPFAQHLTLIGGEPLMYPWIGEVLEVLAEHPIAVTINTNATLVNERLASRLLALSELHLKCSIDAATRDTYFRIRGRDVFERVTENLRDFASRARGKAHLRVIPVYVVMKENLKEVVPFIDLARPWSPHRIEFHPVRHVNTWQVTNGTGWVFKGSEQSCEYFREDYNRVMAEAAATCEREGVTCEVHFL